MNLRGYLKMLRVKEWIKFFAPIPLIGAILAPATPFVLISVGGDLLLCDCFWVRREQLFRC